MPGCDREAVDPVADGSLCETCLPRTENEKPDKSVRNDPAGGRSPDKTL